MLERLKQFSEKAKTEKDVEMQKHLDELDKRELKTTGWTIEPLDNVDHDFVSKLLSRYLGDLEKRIAKQDKEDSGIAMNLRKITSL